jgi:hypothetical protein
MLTDDILEVDSQVAALKLQQREWHPAPLTPSHQSERCFGKATVRFQPVTHPIGNWAWEIVQVTLTNDVTPRLDARYIDILAVQAFKTNARVICLHVRSLA